MSAEARKAKQSKKVDYFDASFLGIENEDEFSRLIDSYLALEVTSTDKQASEQVENQKEVNE